jgi:hypothetical protein
VGGTTDCGVVVYVQVWVCDAGYPTPGADVMVI